MIRYDTTPFIRESIQEVFKTLLDSVMLVALVVLVFLQNWRSAIIPLVAVPVGIVGTFAVMLAMGFSLNNLTLFGLVLAIGIVVDDAIVVVEAVEHHIEHGLKPRAATLKAMSEVSAPVIAVGLVLSAVFIPCAFITGITGQFFRQFALTIASSTVISTLNSLTLSPALAAMLLKPRRKGVYDRLPWPAFVLRRGLGGLRVALALCARAFPEGSVARTGVVAAAVARLRDWPRTSGIRPRAGGPAGVDRRGGLAGLPRDHVAGEPGDGDRLRSASTGGSRPRPTAIPGSSAGCCSGSSVSCWRTAGCWLVTYYVYGGLPERVRDTAPPGRALRPRSRLAERRRYRGG